MSGLPALVRLGEEAAAEGHAIPGAPWMYGIGAFLTLVILMLLVTRLNANR